MKAHGDALVRPGRTSKATFPWTSRTTRSLPFQRPENTVEGRADAPALLRAAARSPGREFLDVFAGAQPKGGTDNAIMTAGIQTFFSFFTACVYAVKVQDDPFFSFSRRHRTGFPRSRPGLEIPHDPASLGPIRVPQKTSTVFPPGPRSWPPASFREGDAEKLQVRNVEHFRGSSGRTLAGPCRS